MKTSIPAWQLYGERRVFPDVMHIERISDRAAGLEWRIAPHRHLALHQVMLLQEGDLALTIDGRDLRPDPPVVVNMPRGTVHGFRFSVGTEGYVLTLPAADFPEVFGADTPAVALTRPFVIAAPAGIEADFARIADLYRRKSPLRLLALRAACTALACAVSEAAQDAEAVRRPAGRDAARVARFLDLIRSGGVGPRGGVAAHAAALGLSPRHLARLCHAATGQSPQALIEAEVMREARRLLVYTRMPVQRVAWQLGFDDPAYFARRFRAQTGQTATAYRAAFDSGETGGGTGSGG